MICDKCKRNFEEKAEKNKTYEGIDYHHNPPIFMFEKNEMWAGKIVLLCRKHHRELHDEILKIMFKHSNLFKPKKSEHWTWIAILPCNRKKVIEEVMKFTKGWLNDS